MSPLGVLIIVLIAAGVIVTLALRIKKPEQGDLDWEVAWLEYQMGNVLRDYIVRSSIGGGTVVFRIYRIEDEPGRCRIFTFNAEHFNAEDARKVMMEGMNH